MRLGEDEKRSTSFSQRRLYHHIHRLSTEFMRIAQIFLLNI